MDLNLLKICLNEIEEKVKLGICDTWTNNEFQKVSDLISIHSGIKISTSTIRRLFDNNKQPTNKPQRETLNALAIFLNYQNWADYVSNKSNPKKNNKRKHSLTQKISLVVGAIIIISLIGVFIQHFKSKEDYSDILFEGAYLISNKVPHTVMVKYDLAQHNESYYVNWNDKPLDGKEAQNPEKLLNQKGMITHTYYNKSIYNIELLNLNGEPIKQLNTKINTNGWECYILQNNKIFYVDSTSFNLQEIFNAEHYIQNETRINKQEEYRLFYRNYGNWEYNSQNFEFSFSIKPDFDIEIIQCHHFQMEMAYEKGSVLLTSQQEGCENGNSIIIGNKAFWGDQVDLSQLSIQNKKETFFKMQFMNQTLSIVKNNENIFNSEINTDLGKILGIRFEFKGNGIVVKPKITQL